MKIHPARQSQFELFPGTAELPDEKTGSNNLLRHLTFSLENLVVLGILLVLGMVVSFSFGVERGKGIARNELEEIRDVGQLKRSAEYRSKEQIRRVSPSESSAQPARASQPQTPSPGADLAVPAVVASSGPENAQEAGSDKVVDKPYTVQVASFKQESYAHKEAETLKAKGYSGEILVMPKGNYSIVCIGRFFQKAEAKLFSNQLKKRYKDCLVRRL